MKLFVSLMLLALFVFAEASSFPDASNYRSGNFVPGPAFFPQLLAVVLFLASGVELYLDARKGKPAAEPEAATAPEPKEPLWNWGTQNMVIIVGLLALFPFFLESVGFAIMGFVLTAVVTWRLKAPPVKCVVFSAALVFVVMFFFKHAFFLQLPAGIWSPV